MLSAHDTAQLDRLTLGLASSRAAAGAAGLRHARARGYGLEVSDHRPYRAGDDPRLIDWNAEARLRQLAVRVHEAEGQAHLHVVLDTSRSMSAKFECAARIAAALMYVATARRDLAGLSLFSSTVHTHLPAARGRAQMHQALTRLSAARPDGASDLSRAFSELAHRVPAPAFVVVVSDFYAPGFGLDGLDQFARRGLDPAAVQIVSDDEAEPAIPHGSRLTDVEGGGVAHADVSMYRRRFAEMTSDMSAHCRAHGMPYLQLRSSARFEHTLDALIRAAIIAGR